MKDYRKNVWLALVCFLLVVVLNFFLPRLLPGGGSVLFISHDRALTDFYCDTVYAFDEDHRLKEVRA